MNAVTLSAFDVESQQGFITRAWQQVDAEELAMALRQMPSKVRGRLLARLKTPTSKADKVAARVLITNLARGTAEERFRAADTITAPLVEELGDCSDIFTLPEQFAERVSDLSDEWGKTIVVLAVAAGMGNEPDRYSAALAACRDAGLLADELSSLADLVQEDADAVLHGNRVRSDHLDYDPGGDTSRPESWEVVETVEAAQLPGLWAEATDAAERIHEAVTAGTVPVASDIEQLLRYSTSVKLTAERLEVDATVAAISEAAVAAEREAAVVALSAELVRLRGPDYLADRVAELRDALAEMLGDPSSVERLHRFTQLVSETDPARRFDLAQRLRSEPPPPSPTLIDAALAGLLELGPPAQRETAGRADSADIPVTRRSTAAVEGAGAGGGGGGVGAGGKAVEPVEEQTGPSAALPAAATQEEMLAVEDAGPAGTLFSPHPDRSEATESSADTAATSEVPAEAVTAEEATAPGSGHVGGRGPDAVEPPSAAGAPDERRDEKLSDPDEMSSGAAGGDRRAGVEDDQGSAPVEEAVPVSEDEANAALARLTAIGRFSLAHHLAAALGQNYRAQILAEAALADAVRTTSSTAGTAFVETALSTPIITSDIGSVALRAASAARVALIDPSSLAAEVLAQLVPALEPWPQFQEFYVAAIGAARQNLAVSAAGTTGDSAAAREQAEAISQWAADTLARPRQNLLHRGTEVWKILTSPDEPFGEILSIVAGNDPGGVEKVRALCDRYRDEKSVKQATRDVDAGLIAGRPGHAQPIMGGAQAQLVRGLTEIVEQARIWASALVSVRSPGDLRALVASKAWQLRQPIAEILARPGAGDWGSAAVYAAMVSLHDTVGLFNDVALGGTELEPSVALNRELTLVSSLTFGEGLIPDRPLTAAEIVAAAEVGREEPFNLRLHTGDMPGAEAIISLTRLEGETFDEAELTQALRARERELSAALWRRWVDLDADFAAARARGRIADEAAAELGGRLLQANPKPDSDASRRDLDRVAHELDMVADGLSAAAQARTLAVNADIEEAISSEEVGPAWAARLGELLERGELGAAEEYLHRARAGEMVPNDPLDIDGPDTALGAILAAHPDGVTDDVIDAARAGNRVGALDFTEVDEASRAAIAASLQAWKDLREGERPAQLETALFPILSLFGILATSIDRPNALRAASSTGAWFVDVLGERSGLAYVPDFGSRSGRRRRFMLCWDERIPVRQLWDSARAHAPDDQPMYVMYFGTLSAKARLDLAAKARSTHGRSVVVIDATVMLRCASAARSSFDVLMRAVLPYAAPNPYEPDRLTGIPVEMFYGRRAERESVKSTSGTSIISGGRRFGKSALLRSVQAELSGDPDVVTELIVIQDVGASPNNDPNELWPRLAVRLAERGVLEAAVDATADAVCSGIRTWLAAHPLQRLLLMLDECDYFLRADAERGFANVVRLRDTMQEGDGRFKVVFSGLQHVARYRRLPNQPLSQLPQPLVIGPLDASAASDLVRRPLHAVGWDITAAQVDRVVTFCACNPSVIQLACEHLLERLDRIEPVTLAPWAIPDDVLDQMLRSPEVAQGVRNRLDLTLNLDHRYKLLAYQLAYKALIDGLGVAVPPAELRRLAAESWPAGFANQRPDDVRALCDELVGLGVFAGDAESGYRMLSPGMVRVFGSADEVLQELAAAWDYETERAGGAAGSRLRLRNLGPHRFSPLSAAQLADVIGPGRTQLRVVVGSRALRVDAVSTALAFACRERLPGTTPLEVPTLKAWRDAMRAPAAGHTVVISDMTVDRSPASWEQSLESARRRGATRSGRGTRAAVLVAGPSQRWLLGRLAAGDLTDIAVPLRRVDALSLQAWDHIEELDVSLPARQRRLLEVTGGWPWLIEQVLAARTASGFNEAVAEVEAHLAGPQGAAELVAAVGLNPDDPDQRADRGLVAVFDRLVETAWREQPADLVDLLAELLVEDGGDQLEADPAEAVAILSMIGALDEDEDGALSVESVLARCWKLSKAGADAATA